MSESGKALLDVLQRCPASDSDDSAPKPDFTAATHSIMGVLHQVMQVRPTVTPLGPHAGLRWTDADFLLLLRVTMRWREHGNTASSASISACSFVCFNRMLNRYEL